MAYNKFIVRNGPILLDLTPDTITPKDVRQGVIFHAKNGKSYIGELADGIEIDTTEINSNGELVIAYSDGTSKNLGNVVGPKGRDGIDGGNGLDGKNGIDGVGIQNIVIDDTGNLSIMLTNNTTLNLGSIKGTSGKDGVNGLDGKDGSDGKNGIDGKTPYIKEGYWWIGETNTNVKAEGTSGVNGKDGKDGLNGINGKNGISAFEEAQAGGYTGTEADFITSLANIIDKRNITLGLHTDGLIYLFINNSPVGYGVALPSTSISDVVGNIDSDNNIIITGELGDGTYTVKYEMTNGSTINIGDLVLDSNVYYSITKNLSQGTISSNDATSVIKGNNYSTNISASDGYKITSIIVTMGGKDISVTAVSDTTISITNVTGNLIITVAAEEAAVVTYTNFFVQSEGGFGRIGGSDGAIRTDAPNNFVTNFVAVQKGDTIRITGCDITGLLAGGSSASYYSVGCYDSSKVKLYVNSADVTDGVYFTTETDTDTLAELTVTGENVKYMRFTCSHSSGSHKLIDPSTIVININRGGEWL